MNGELTERERAIFDMWPRFEDGEPVMIGDEVGGLGGEITEVYITENEAAIWNSSANHMHLRPGERVKRPVQSVLDADGVEIKVGDTVWSSMYGGNEFTVSRFAKNCKGETLVMVEEMGSGLPPLTVAHTSPDSWERLEEDAEKNPFDYCKDVGHRLDTCENSEAYKARNIVRRAKKLAGVER